MRSGQTEKERRRLERDDAVVMAMASMYCRGHGHSLVRGGLCDECRELVDYARQRTEACPRDRKGVCEECPIQCYRPTMRERIRKVMAWSGPRMMARHPLMAFRHVARKACSGYRHREDASMEARKGKQ